MQSNAANARALVKILSMEPREIATNSANNCSPILQYVLLLSISSTQEFSNLQKRTFQHLSMSVFSPKKLNLFVIFIFIGHFGNIQTHY